jgi:hypothetical protein
VARESGIGWALLFFFLSQNLILLNLGEMGPRMHPSENLLSIAYVKN